MMNHQLQANIIGFFGKPSSVFATYNDETGVLAIAVEASFRRERRIPCLVITNDRDTEDRDRMISTENLRESIQAYYSFKNGVALDDKSPALTFGERAMRASPENSIETDGYDESGPRYRLADTITNAHVATLALALLAARQRGTEDMCSALDRLKGGQLSTFGYKEPWYAERHFQHGFQVDIRAAVK